MRHFDFLPVVVVWALMCGSCETTANFMTYSSLAGHVIKAEYRDKTVTANSNLDCFLSLCAGRFIRCAVSYNRFDRQCISAPVSGWLITWDPNMFTSINPSWVTYITSASPQVIDRPSVLYLLDSVSKGTNLGAKGGQVNLIETGLTEWNEVGPRGVHSHLKYLISGASNRAQIPYKTAAGSYHIDFTGSYTLAAWVKTDTSVSDILPIIEGRPDLSLPDFWFAPSKNQDQLMLAPKLQNAGSSSYVHYYMSPKNSTDKESWRHVAVVYKGFEDVQFYLNGKSHGETINVNAHEDVKKLPDKLCLGNAEAYKQLPAAMACVTIHENALSRDEVAALMAVCP